MKKIISILLVFSLAIVLMATGCGGNKANPAAPKDEKAKPITIKISTVQMPQQQMGIGIKSLSEKLTQRLGAKVDVKTFPGAQLYSGPEEIEALVRGELQMAYVIGSSTETVSQTLQLIKLPFLFPSDDVGYKALEGQTGKALFKPLNDKGLEVMSIFSSGNAAVANNKRALKVLADFKGLKLRTPGKMDSLTVTKLGAIAMVTPSEETYTAIQQGVVDGMSTPSSVFIQRKYYEIQKYVTDGGNMSFQLGFLLVNRNFLNSLPEDTKKVVVDTIKEVEKELRDQIKKDNANLFLQMKEKGCEVYTLTPENVAEWQKATASVYDEMSSVVGADLIATAKKEVADLSKK